MNLTLIKNFFTSDKSEPAKIGRVIRRSFRIKRNSNSIHEKRKSDSFVNSQEWTLSRTVPDIRLGIVGSLNSGKSALVHRYLTGSYMQEESPEGGRFKKEVQIDNQSYLLLIRDEGGSPELQFSAWVDAVIFVFSLENEASFNAIYAYYTKMSHYRNVENIPIILVGTQDAISERCPRVIDDSRARKLANDLKRCSYFETCATYGLNVERVFQEACQKIVQTRSIIPALTPTNSRPTTPTTRLGVTSLHGYSYGQSQNMSPTNTNGLTTTAPPVNALNINSLSPSHHLNSSLPHHRQHSLSSTSSHVPVNKANSDLSSLDGSSHSPLMGKNSNISLQPQPQGLITMLGSDNNNMNMKFIQHERSSMPPPSSLENLQLLSIIPPPPQKEKELPTPTSTPTTSRKSRRRSNLFIPSKKEDKLKNVETDKLGSGRSIPIKQGYLYKRSSKALNKEWKKKYVTLCDDGRLTYHSSLHDYMDNIHGKEISLQYVTVKIPGQKPKSIITNSALTKQAAMLNKNGGIFNNNNNINNNNTNSITESLGVLSLLNKDKKATANDNKVLLTAYDNLKEPGKASSQSGDESGIALSNSNSQNLGSDSNNKIDAQTPNVKKRHRRMKSSGIKNNDTEDQDGFEFYIVSLDNKQWHFEAANSEERDEWVCVIEQEIFKSLQGNESSKPKTQSSDDVAQLMLNIRSQVSGNGFCVDCDGPSPEWASLNLGVLMCIECSGIHRNMGSHISKVRSLTLDEWPPAHLAVMLSIGNSLSNSVWEANTRGQAKPVQTSSREEKENWIRRKYEAKEFLQPLNTTVSIGQQLIESVVKSDMKTIILLLAHTNNEFVNCTVNSRDLRTPLHFSCAIGNLSITQILIWYNANLKQTDHEGRTCLTYATAANSLAIVKQSNNKPHHVSSETTTALVNLLVSLECTDPHPLCQTNIGNQSTNSSTTLARHPFDKVPSSVV
ncbi:centaurin-gamma-1A isoform X2 [Chironomus tepperi]|uniref:centaurin-gamma-1A isoform X2 n=1 Tax=Chironomus tepperi TaxID=113505 RepID=UPI00391F3DAF